MAAMERQMRRAEDFLRRFEKNSQDEGASELLTQFGEEFLAGGPEGARVLRREMFAAALPRRRQIFREMGLRSSELAGMEILPLDARYTLARTQWRMMFERGTETVASSFLLEDAADGLRIILYLSHQNLLSSFKGRGAGGGT